MYHVVRRFSHTRKLPLVSKEVKINEENQRDFCPGGIKFVTGCPSLLSKQLVIGTEITKSMFARHKFTWHPQGKLVLSALVSKFLQEKSCQVIHYIWLRCMLQKTKQDVFLNPFAREHKSNIDINLKSSNTTDQYNIPWDLCVLHWLMLADTHAVFCPL